MSVKELKTKFSRSFYLVVTLFVKVLLFVQVPFTKKKSPHQIPAPTKSEPDLPPPLLKYAAATLLYKFFFTSKIQLPKTIVIDETYISIFGKTYYLYAALAPYKRQILAFFISNKRNGNSAFNLLQLLVTRVVDKKVKCRIVTDGALY